MDGAGPVPRHRWGEEYNTLRTGNVNFHPMDKITQQLFTAACAVRDNAHAPYSNFPVGAALLAGGKVYRGCNVENAAHPQGVCAEAAAIAAMVGDGASRIEALVVVGDGDCVPCGGCLQKIAEFAGAETPLIVATPEGKTRRLTLRDCLPLPFAK